MSGAAGFHRTAVDRSYAGSRQLGYDSRGGMSSILSHDAPKPVAAPLSDRRGGSQVAAALNEQPAAAPSPRKAQGPRSELDEVMHGIGRIEMPRGIAPAGRHQRAGGSMAAALQPEAQEAAVEEDPFGCARNGRGRRVAGGHASSELGAVDGFLPPKGTLPPARAPAAGGGEDDAVHQQLAGLHGELQRTCAGLARDAEGALCDYRPLLAVLEAAGLRLGPDAAGTLIATCDVQGGISFEEFMQVIAMGFGEEAAPQPPPPPPEPAQQAMAAKFQKPIGVRGPPGGSMGYGGFAPVGAEAPAPPDVRQMLQGKNVGGAAASMEIAALLNGTAHHGRKSAQGDIGLTVGRSSQMR